MSKNYKAGKAAWRVLTLMTAASVMAGGAVYAAVPSVPEKVQDKQHEINQNINALPVNPGRNVQGREKQGTAEVENQLPEKGGEQQNVKFTIQNFRLDARERPVRPCCHLCHSRWNSFRDRGRSQIRGESD